MISKGVQIKFKHAFAEGFITLVDSMLQQKYTDDDDKLMLAALAEIRHRFYIRIEKAQQEYTMTLSAAQALAVRILYTDFINDPTTYMGSKLLLISQEVGKKFAT